MPELTTDFLAVMREELEKALAKPATQRSWAMVIDRKKCIGCHACTVSCMAENVLPPGVVYRRVADEETGRYPDVVRVFTPKPCMQCDNPYCVTVCPVKATFKRPDKIVEIDYNKCIGCGRCVVACPYGARTLDRGKFHTSGTPEVMAYEKRVTYDYQKTWQRTGTGVKAPVGRARKCHFCLHRINEGDLPACVITCIGRATYFGDLSDPNSTVSKLLKTRKYEVLRPEKGTKPRVYYLK
ncbi:4Fe-4S dicluster domain-containing protein [Carboxydothermus ferrireducens]|uniref:Molybdopterin-containing oxidoreductase family iron-sulfur binding subunit n=1 Tax=Carboxydothermus ferrireducens DSM 11255 TaxID=1119529 RepID=A0ABX2R6I2_9THEO|nr:4Fe-4S dicluster domain-containing protein [Carboxydothermus ferrireducens]NYE56776.1 molybdopterin-containing oxidoreductase family iron-sulfur binding subunit [Carboxydothermus ferrireducens DSM 11255]